MASTYTTNLRFNKQGQGDNRNSWGTVFNSGGGSDLLDSAIAGFTTKAMGDANVALSTANGSADEARAMMVKVTGAHTAIRTLTIPAVSKFYLIQNATTGGFGVTVSNGSNSVTIAAASTALVYTDGSAVSQFLPGGSATTLDITSTDAGAAVGPSATLYRNSATPAANDLLGEIKYDGEDSAGNQTTYARTYGGINATTNGAESGFYYIETLLAGSALALQIQGRAIGRSVATDRITLTGDVPSSVANSVDVYGSSHATQANDITITSNNNVVYQWDNSAARHTFTGTLVAADASILDGNITLANGYLSTPGTIGGTYTASTGQLALAVNGTACVFNRSDADNTQLAIITFVRNGTSLNGISATNTTVTYSTTSDYRAKENVTPLAGAWGRVMRLRPVNFTWKDNPDFGYVDGFIAHEFGEEIKEGTVGEKDAVDVDGKPIHQGTDPSKAVALLTAALQEAMMRIEKLEGLQ